MGDTLAGTGTRSPPISGAVLEVRGFFPGDAALEDAMSRLKIAGFDRADMNLPLSGPPSEATPEHGADDPDTDEDKQQVRTLGAGLAGTAAALLAAGVVIGTGGAAAPAAVVAAVAAGAAAGGVAHSVHHGSDGESHRQREAAAARGELILAVNVADAVKQAQAEAAMREAGATRVEAVVRT